MISTLTSRTGWAALFLGSLLIAGHGLFYPWIVQAMPNPAIPFRPLLGVHAVAGGAALLLGPFQFVGRLRARRPSLHRTIGKLYLLACGVGGATGLMLALQSTAGPVAQSGFAALAIAWLASAFFGYSNARRKNFAAHRQWMIRSFALTFAAVTLRIYLPASMAAGAEFMTVYPAIAWLCWVPNLLVAELLIRSRRPLLQAPSPSAIAA